MNNFHLIAVHFPIAFLTLYAVLEIISLRRMRALGYWWHLKAILAIVGTIALWGTRQTGEMIEAEFAYIKNVVEVHALWANCTTGIFTVLGVSYAIAWINRSYGEAIVRISWLVAVWKLFVKISAVVLSRGVSSILAGLGLVAITITGALGGAIANGPDIDPIVRIVYRFLIGTPES